MLTSALEAMDEHDYAAAERILRLVQTQISTEPVVVDFEPPPPLMTTPKLILWLVLGASCVFCWWGLWSFLSVIWAMR